MGFRFNISKPSDSFIIKLLTLVSLFLMLSLLWLINNKYSIDVISGGGAINHASYKKLISVNPYLATTSSEKYLANLIHSSLIRLDKDGKYILEVVDSYEEKETNNGKIEFIFQLKKNVYFHDMEKLTAKDVIFTTDFIKSNFVDSEYANYLNKLNMTQTDNGLSIKIDIEDRYLILDALTFPILPSHIWKKTFKNTDKNSINNLIFLTGSGRFQVIDINKNAVGMIDNMSLFYNKKYFTKGKIKIHNYNINIYEDFEKLKQAYDSSDVNLVTDITPEEAKELNRKKWGNVLLQKTNVIYSIAFNKNQEKILNDPLLRGTLAEKINRDKIISNVFSGYAVKVVEPAVNYKLTSEQNYLSNKILIKTLEDIGWVLDIIRNVRLKNDVELELKILVPNQKEFVKTAEILKEEWAELNINLNIETIDIDDYIAEKYEKNDYDIYFVQYTVKFKEDLFHVFNLSNPKGIAQKYNVWSNKLDSHRINLLETTNKEKVYTELKKEIKTLSSLIFLYSPLSVTVISKDIKFIDGTPKSKIISNFVSIEKLFIKTQKLLNFN